MRKLLTSVSAGVFMAFAAVAPALAAAAFTNGSFETGIDPGTFTTLNAGDSTSVNGWSVTAGSVDYIGMYWSASNGTRSFDMSGNDAGAISQTFSTVAGHNYTVTFDLAGNPDGTPSVKTLTVDSGGTPMPYTFDTTGHTDGSMGWAPQSYNFTATGSSTPLTFTSTTAGAFGPALDNVALTLNAPTLKSQCKDGGWKEYTNPSFNNKDKCIDYVVNHGHKTNGDVTYTAYGLKRHAEFRADSYSKNTGYFKYSDANNASYKVKVSLVKFSGNDAWFAGVVTTASNPSWVGNWLFAKVHNGIPDQIWGSFTDQATAQAGVNGMTNPGDGPFSVTKGDLKVN